MYFLFFVDKEFLLKSFIKKFNYNFGYRFLELC